MLFVIAVILLFILRLLFAVVKNLQVIAKNQAVQTNAIVQGITVKEKR